MNYLDYNLRKNTANELRGLMEQFFNPWTPASFHDQSAQNWKPQCDVIEEEGHYLINLEMPGVPKDQLKIEALGNELVISGERKSDTVRKEISLHYTERSFGKFRRTFNLPPSVDTAKIEADYQDGMLRLFIPKAEASKKREIKIGASTQAGLFSKLMPQSFVRNKEAGSLDDEAAS